MPTSDWVTTIALVLETSGCKLATIVKIITWVYTQANHVLPNSHAIDRKGDKTIYVDWPHSSIARIDQQVFTGYNVKYVFW